MAPQMRPYIDMSMACGAAANLWKKVRPCTQSSTSMTPGAKERCATATGPARPADIFAVTIHDNGYRYDVHVFYTDDEKLRRRRRSGKAATCGNLGPSILGCVEAHDKRVLVLAWRLEPCAVSVPAKGTVSTAIGDSSSANATTDGRSKASTLDGRSDVVRMLVLPSSLGKFVGSSDTCMLVLLVEMSSDRDAGVVLACGVSCSVSSHMGATSSMASRRVSRVLAGGRWKNNLSIASCASFQIGPAWKKK